MLSSYTPEGLVRFGDDSLRYDEDHYSVLLFCYPQRRGVASYAGVRDVVSSRLLH